MKKIKFTSIILIFTMLFSLTINNLSGSCSAAAMTSSEIVISSELSQPISVVEKDGKLYVSEYGGGNIYKMDTDGQNKTVFKNGLNTPIGMAFDDAGNLYVAEHHGTKVSKFDTNGNLILEKTIGTGLLTGLAIDSNNNIFVADFSLGKIYKMNSSFGDFTEFATGLLGASLIGVAIDKNDNLYVSSRAGNKIIKIDPSGNVTDFATNIMAPNWVALCEDGYFYTSEWNSRTIVKVDSNGNKVGSFSSISAPWGLDVTEDGYIYYTDLSNSVRKIVGSASTLDKTHITLTMNTTMSAIHADPEAFNVTGISSNPQIIAAVVTGQSIKLTLDAPIASLDNIKVNYNKTGTNNLIVSGSTYELGDFTGLPVVNSIINVISVSNISPINVANGTLLNGVGLPTSVNVFLINATTTSVAITWDAGTPEYNGNKAGTYVFSGTLELSGAMSNPNNLKASVDVAVEEVVISNITTVSSISSINVANGTSLNGVGLPTNVNVFLSNATTTSAAITWDAGTPEYNGSRAGTYAFSGTLELSGAMSNPNNLKASVDVIVQSASSSSNSNKTPVKYVPVIINGKVQNLGTRNEMTVGGVKKVTIDVNDDILNKYINDVLNKPANGELNIIEVPVTGKGEANIYVTLTGEIIEKMSKNNFDLKVTYDSVGYTIPAEQIGILEIAKKLDTLGDLSKLEIKIEISVPSDAVIKNIMKQVDVKDYELVIPPMNFDISVTNTATDKMVTVSKFKDYVERIFEIPTGINSNKITTGIVCNEDGTFSHIPTKVVKIVDKYYAKLNSMTNSIYSVIWNPITFKDMEGHWAKATANNMASRLIVNGVGNDNFDPDRDITRGEFASVITKSLGIFRTNVGMDKFSDVVKDNIFYDAITIADNYGLIKGYPDGSYAPNKKITREEAMTILIRASEFVKLEANNGNTIDNFDDAVKVSAWAKEYVITSIEKGVIVGSNGKIRPQDFISRAEVATAIERFLINTGLIN